MNRLIYFILIYILSFAPLSAQDLVRIDTLTGKFKMVENATDQLIPNGLISNNDALINILEPLNLSLKEGTDLSLDFQLIDLEKDFYYDPIQLKITDSDQQIIPLKIEKLRGDLEAINFNNQKGLYHIALNDALEESLYYGYEYELQLICKLYGTGLNCQQDKPKFSWSIADRWPYYASTVAGGIFITVGLFQDKKRTIAYKEYVGPWEEGKTKGTAIPHLDKAKIHQNNRNAFLIVGGSLITASALGLLYRYIFKHRPKINNYYKYCGEKKSTTKRSPVLVPANNGLGFALEF